MATENVTVKRGAAVGGDEVQEVIRFLEEMATRLKAGEDITLAIAARIPGTGGTGVRMIGSVSEIAKALLAIPAGLKDIKEQQREESKVKSN